MSGLRDYYWFDMKVSPKLKKGCARFGTPFFIRVIIRTDPYYLRGSIRTEEV